MRASDHLVASYLRHPTHGPLPAILLALTVTTGVVDAVSCADLRKRDVATVVRRLSAVVAMLVGAAVGASLVLSAGLTAGLTTVLVLSVLTLVPAVVAHGRPPCGPARRERAELR